jgi:DnaJ-class molecular chaperone
VDGLGGVKNKKMLLMRCKECNGTGYKYIDIDWNRPTPTMGSYRKCSRCKGSGTTGAEFVKQTLEAIVIESNQGILTVKKAVGYVKEALEEYSNIEQDKVLQKGGKRKA